MAVFQIGRLFSDYDVDITRSSWAGSRWSVSGDVVLPGANRADEGVAIRDQIIGMNGNPDEPFVAVQWSEDPTLDGFYRLVGVRCEGGQMFLTDGLLSWSAELDRVTAGQSAPLESICSWQLLTNNRSVTAGTYSAVDVTQWAVPGEAFEVGASGTVSGSETSLVGSPDTIATGFGTVYRVGNNVTLPASGIWAWSVDPGDYYEANCLVTTDFGAATDQKVFGRRSDRSTNWVVSNGMIRFFVDAAASNTLRVEKWTGAAWTRVNSTNFRFEYDTSAVEYEAMTILRNSPECVAVRLACRWSGAFIMRVYIDLTIMRGSWMVYGYLSVPSNFAGYGKAAIETTGSVASTAITGGFRATSADASGNQLIVVTGTPACTDTVASGKTETTAVTGSLSFGLSAAETGGSTLVAGEFFARRAETTRVVDR